MSKFIKNFLTVFTNRKVKKSMQEEVEELNIRISVLNTPAERLAMRLCAIPHILSKTINNTLERFLIGFIITLVLLFVFAIAFDLVMGIMSFEALPEILFGNTFK